MSKYKRVYYNDTGKLVGEGPRIKEEFSSMVQYFYDTKVPGTVDFFDVEALLHRCIFDESRAARDKKHGGKE